jgi:universal stress protein A
MGSIKTILWPTDASESALKALEKAVLLARQFGAKIHALQVVQRVPTMAEIGLAGTTAPAFNLPLYEHQLVEAAREALVKTVADNVPDELETEIHVATGTAKMVILDFARDNAIDLIVMATHGRQGLSHLMLGSVAESVIRQAPVPTLVVPYSDRNDG